MARFFCWYGRCWRWTAIAVLSLPAAAVPGQAQDAPTTVPLGSVQELPSNVAPIDSGIDSVPLEKAVRFSKESPGVGGGDR